MINPEVDEFLAHYGVLGMKWGVRRDKKRAKAQREARKKGMGVRQLQSESKRIKEAGGGIRGTVKVRKEMIDRGELSREQARKGRNKMLRNVAISTAAGAALTGIFIASSRANMRVGSLPKPPKNGLSVVSNEIFRAKGPGWEIQAGNKIYTDVLNTVVSDIVGRK